MAKTSAGLEQKEPKPQQEVTLRFNYPFPEKGLTYDYRWGDPAFRQKWNMMTSWLGFNALKIKILNFNNINIESLKDLGPTLQYCTNTQELLMSGVNDLWSQASIIELAALLPKVSKLDISKSNLQIKDIESILSFINHFPNLKHLSLAGSEHLFDNYDYRNDSTILRALASKFETLDHLDLSNTSIPPRYITSIFKKVPAVLNLEGIALYDDGMSNLVTCLKLAKPGTVINLKGAIVEPGSEWSLIEDLCHHNQSLTVTLSPETINRSAEVKQLVQQRSEPGIKGFTKVIFDDTNISVFVEQFCAPEENNTILPVNKVQNDCAELSQVLSERTKQYGHYKSKLLVSPSEWSCSEDSSSVGMASDEITALPN